MSGGDKWGGSNDLRERERGSDNGAIPSGFILSPDSGARWPR